MASTVARLTYEQKRLTSPANQRGVSLLRRCHCGLIADTQEFMLGMPSGLLCKKHAREATAIWADARAPESAQKQESGGDDA